MTDVKWRPLARPSVRASAPVIGWTAWSGDRGTITQRRDRPIDRKVR